MMSNKKSKALVGMSGGVDSSVAALMLLKDGYEAVGVTLKLYENKAQSVAGQTTCGSLSDVDDAKTVCDRLGMEHLVLDFSDRFEECVIKQFAKEYRLGRTPNPCIECNRHMKFSGMLEKATELSADFIAMGHYAQVKKFGDRFFLTRPVDQSKDQTYVLYMLSQETLARTLFPLGSLTKSEVREIAEENDFVNANKPDSQDICFVPDKDYASFIKEYDGKPLGVGNFVDKDGKILGKHMGIEKYTIGQRKGLGIGFGKPMFVVSKNVSTRDVILGEETDLFTKTVRVENTVFSAFDKFDAPIKCKGKLRYRQREEDCIIHPISETAVVAEFLEPQRAPAAGQAAVFYDGDTVLGGGTIVF